MFDPLIILLALGFGIGARALGLPALLGYLAAGFALHELNVESGEFLQTLSDIGITLLLFTIGLKLEFKDLLKPSVWGTTLIHMLATQAFFMVLLAVAVTSGFLVLSWPAIAVIAFALTFSSTVFVIQVLQERGESASRHAKLAIGILIVQDLAAVIFLAFAAGKVPTIEALALLLLIPLRPVLLKLLSYCGYGELFTLAGLTLALGGAALCEMVGVKGDLGALIIAASLAGHQKAKELSRNLMQFKDLFLVSFFLLIGLSGWPALEIMAVALVIGILSVLKPVLYYPLLTRLHVPARVSFLSSMTLGNYSEFGLIVLAVAASAGWVGAQWSGAISLAIAVSFIVSSPINTKAHAWYRKWQPVLRRYETVRVRESRPDTSKVKVLVLGMGNIGEGAYEDLATEYGYGVLGVDDNDTKLLKHMAHHRRVVAADATDPDFWARIDLSSLKLVMLALTNHQENMVVTRLLKEFDYEGHIAAVVRFPEEAQELEEQGISAFYLFAQAGSGFAAHARAQLAD